MADRSLANAQLDGGSREVQVAGGCLEGSKGVEGKLRAIHYQPLIILMALSRYDPLSGLSSGLMIGRKGERTMISRTMLMAAAALSGPVSSQVPDDPLTKPLAVEREAEWLAPVNPVRVFGKTYLVGFGGLNIAMIDTGAGLILVDAGLPQAEPKILANVAKLGFSPRDIKYILSTEPHFDHAGGLAALVRDTGATVIASPRAAQALRTGRLASDDPQLAYDSRFPPLQNVRVIADVEKLRLGDTTVIARATPGHTAGSMSWAWRSCEAAQCRSIVFGSSLNPVAAKGYRYSSPAGQTVVASFRRAYATMNTLPCDILITAHVEQSGSNGRFATTPDPCRTYVRASQRALAARLETERRK